MSRRPVLSRARIVEAAVRVADDGGLAALSMRHVGRELGVEAMSLYHHVRNKEDLLDALADWPYTRIELPVAGGAWRAEMTSRAASARDVLTAHPWALGLLESRRNPGSALLTHHERVLGCLRAGGFPVRLAARAFSAIDAYVYGFVLTELSLPMRPGEDAEEFVAGIGLSAEEHPHLAAVVSEQITGRDFAYGEEFGYGLDLILDGLEDRLSGSCVDR